MHLSRRKLAILSLIAANIIWGSSFPIYKWTLTDIPPFTFVFLRFFLGAIIIFPFTNHNLKIEKEDIWKLIAGSFIGISLAISLLFLGLQLAPSINAPIIFSSSPALLLLAAIFYMKEKPKPKIIIGTIISLLGVILIIVRPVLENGFKGAILGNIFFIFALIADTSHTIILKRFIRKYSSLTLVFWSFIIGTIPLVPFVIMESSKFNILKDLTINGYIGILYGSVFAAVLAHILYTFGIKLIKTSEIGIFSYVDPVTTAIVAVPLLGESITFYYLLGSVLVFLGIFIAERRINYHPLHLLRFDKD